MSGEEHKAMSQATAYYNPDFYSQFEEMALASARVMVPILLELVEVQSVIDIGCGTGAWLSVFRENGIEDLRGVDGPHVNINQLKIPAQQFTSTDLEQPFHMSRKYDLVVSLEVAEHLSEGSAETFVKTLTGHGPVVLFSAAIPHQGGVNHKNEQWPEYWTKQFNSNGYVAIDAIRRRVWTNENVEVWYAQNTLLFVAQQQLQNYPLLRKEYAAYPLSIVHPKLLLAKVEEVNWVEALAAEALEGPQAPEEPQAPEPTAVTPPELNAGAAGGDPAPAGLSEGAGQVLQSPLLQRLPSPLLALLLIVFGPERIGQMAHGVERFTSGALNSVEEAKAEFTAMDLPQPQAPEPTAVTRPEVNAGAAGGDNMRIVYIILAHRLPNQLARLVSRLDAPSVSFFIHIDANTDDATHAEMVDGIIGRYNVHFLPRHQCTWGGWGIVAATLEGLEQVIRAKVLPDYVILLSGQDYPLRTPGDIEAFLAEHRGTSFIDARQLPDYTWNWHGAMDRFHGQPLPSGMKPFGGSQWWALSGDCAAYVKGVADGGLIPLFEGVAIPDEHFVQTVVANSPFRDRLSRVDAAAVKGVHYIDWDRGSPKVLGVEDFERLIASRALFARKFDMAEDSAILDMIDAHSSRPNLNHHVMRDKLVADPPLG